MGDYGDFVMQVDGVVGRILSVLEERDLASNTIVIVTSDNGAHCTPADIAQHRHNANAPWRGMKADLFEGGHRVPFLVRWPGEVKAGTTSHALIGLQDIFATMADVLDAKVPPDAAEDSLSFLKALRGRRQGERQVQVHHSINGSFAIREGTWKLLIAPSSGGWSEPRPNSNRANQLPDVQLYNLQLDPAESTNLARREPRTVERLMRRMEELIRRGRSTPGPVQSNDAEIRLRKERE
jgi:arylsulfatase A-like enzyme